MILDTNALSAISDADPAAVAYLAKATRLAVPVIVLGEYRLGITQSRYRASYESWLEEWSRAATVLDVNLETTQYYSAIGLELRSIGKPIPTNDMWIAALSRQHGLPVLTRDRHFDFVPRLKRLSW